MTKPAARKPAPPRKPATAPKHSYRRPAIITGIVILLGIAFVVFAYVQNGSVQGFWLEHQRFPGANAKSLVEGRKQVRDALANANAAVSGLSPIYASGLVTNEDGCRKGTHETAISIEPSNDNYAYECSIDTTQYYAFGQSRCEISAALLGLKSEFSGFSCDTGAANDNFYSVDKDKYDGGPMIWAMVQDVSAFKLENSDEVIGEAVFNPCHYAPAQEVYCSSHDVPTKITDKIPANVQTVVTVSTNQSTYYRK